MTGSRTSRRTVLRLGATAAIGTLLAGCASNPTAEPRGEQSAEPAEPPMGPVGPMGPQVDPGAGGAQTQHDPGDHYAPHGPHGHMYPHGAVTPTGTSVDGRGIGEWFANVDNYEGVVDSTDRTRVRASVGAPGNGGGFAFEPAAIRVSPGTTVTWEWTGAGGAHDVVAVDGSFASELLAEGGRSFSHVFDRPGTYRYYCRPHRSIGMKGAVVVE